MKKTGLGIQELLYYERAQIVAFRNLVVHEYFRVSLNLVWAIVQNNLPPLKVTVEQILQELLET